MTKPIEPGCLCVIVGGKIPENIGKVVTAVRWVVKDEIIPECGDRRVGQNAWLCEVDSGYLVAVARSIFGERRINIAISPVEPWALMRIDDGEQTDNTTTKKDELCNA